MRILVRRLLSLTGIMVPGGRRLRNDTIARRRRGSVYSVELKPSTELKWSENKKMPGDARRDGDSIVPKLKSARSSTAGDYGR